LLSIINFVETNINSLFCLNRCTYKLKHSFFKEEETLVLTHCKIFVMIIVLDILCCDEMWRTILGRHNTIINLLVTTWQLYNISKIEGSFFVLKCINLDKINIKQYWKFNWQSFWCSTLKHRHSGFRSFKIQTCEWSSISADFPFVNSYISINKSVFCGTFFASSAFPF
jgi:hypothetical protein